nr:capsular polysaccharide biosynthesis protein [Caldimonas thermodepolymerans]
MTRVPTLPALLHEYEIKFGRHRFLPGSTILGWGYKRSGEMARKLAKRHGLPLLYIEDGFLRSVSLDDPPLSIVVDDLGIYYDATSPSRLETLIGRTHTQEELSRAALLRNRWRQGRLSKYNHAREAASTPDTPYVLVVDQTFGDASITHGAADAGSFARMLEAALDEHPQLPVLLKTHPEVVAGRKRGHFETLTPGQAARVRLCAEDVHPCSMLDRAIAVYTVTSQVGFEALLWERPVRCFGMPFYAGWGLTTDELPAPARRRTVQLDDLVHGALVEYARYVDPETMQRCEPERLIEWMSLQRRMRERFPAEVHAIGFSQWKKPIVRAYFSGSRVTFHKDVEQVPSGQTLAVWGRRGVPASKQPSTVVRLEDGFLRSVGLGADLVRPLSWVMDRTGIYYDATAPSDLELLLQHATFDDALLERARRLRERIVAAGITKYNVGAGTWSPPDAGRPIVLVPGQVESDASIALGALGIRTNIGLLQAVRRSAPDAYIVYKPHPDVVARLRNPGQGEAEAERYCDEVVVDTPMHVLLDQVDAVHVLTSLAGFEALLRGKAVTCHGHPFYAGWGLTNDRTVHPRRTRKLELDELVAGALILYPTYVSRITNAFTTPEQALDELLTWRAQGPVQTQWWRKARRWVLAWRERLGLSDTKI